jgi:hypothetical protein
MTSPIPAETMEAYASLSALVYSGADTQAVLDAICEVAVEVIPGADHVCISTLTRDNRLQSRAASDDVARLMDQLESDAQEGPCLDSIKGDSVQRDEDIADRSTWPALAELCLSRTPVRGMIGYRLQEGLGGRSALNVFSDTPGALTDESTGVGALFASFASVALLAAERRHDAENLRRGLASNREIGKAVGLLMATHQVDAEEAFQILRRASSRTNTKLAAIAERITADHGQVGV